MRWARALRRSCHALPFDVSIVLDRPRGGVLVSTDAGKCVRPLFVASELGRLKEVRERYRGRPSWWFSRLWQTLVAEGIVEYLDKEEELCGDYKVAPRPSPDSRGATHYEIDPVAVFGLVSCSQPFLNHNQAPRNIYQTSMGEAGPRSRGAELARPLRPAPLHHQLPPAAGRHHAAGGAAVRGRAPPGAHGDRGHHVLRRLQPGGLGAPQSGLRGPRPRAASRTTASTRTAA